MALGELEACSETEQLFRRGHKSIAAQLSGRELVDIAPNPRLARLDRPNERML